MKAISNQNLKGFTLIELVVVLAIIGIVAAVATPDLLESIERGKIKSAAETIKSDLLWARSESIKQNQQITIDFISGAGGSWSYQINSNPVKTVSSSNFDDFSDIKLTQDFASAETGFDPVRGIALDNGAVTLASTNFSVQVRVSTMGRVNICSASGLAGVDAC